MNIDKSLFGKTIEVGKNKYPKIIYGGRDIDFVLKEFFKSSVNVGKLFGKILTLYGFTKDDVIELRNVRECSNGFVFDYIVNGIEDKDNIICLKYDNLIFKNSIIVSDKDKSIGTRPSVYSRRSIRVIPVEKEEKLDNGKIYSRSYGYYDAVYTIRINDIEIKLELTLKKKYYDEDTMLYIDNDLDIENYFKNIDLSLGIDDLYKDISKYLGDVSLYTNIDLRITKLSNDINKEDNITDMICLNYGECVQFMMTRGNKCVSIDKDGNCISKYNDNNGTIVTTLNNDNATYSISGKNYLLLREQIFIYGVNGYENAIDEIVDAKNKILELVPKKK